MRDLLVPLNGQRLTFKATFTRFGCRPYYKELYLQTVLLEHVTTLDGVPAADHLWMIYGERLAVFDLKRGDRLTFQARVRPYLKHRVYTRNNGRMKRVFSQVDYKLAYPTRIVHEPVARDDAKSCSGVQIYSGNEIV